MKKHIYIIQQFISKLKKMNISIFVLFLFKVKGDINLILKFILLLVGSKTNDFNSIWDLDDLFLKIVEDESIKKDINDGDKTAQITELIKDAKEGKDVDFSSMEMGEWLDYLREHEPRAYWFWVLAFCATSVFCVWLMHYILGGSMPPKEPY